MRLFLFTMVAAAGLSAQSGQPSVLERMEESRQCFALRQMVGMEQLTPPDRAFFGGSLALQFHNEPVAIAALESQLPEAKGDRRRRILELLREAYTKVGAYAKASVQATALLNEFPNYRSSALSKTARLMAGLADVPPQTVQLGPPSAVPLTRDEYGLPVAVVTVQGTPKPFLIDTGASLSLVSASLAKELGLQIIPGQYELGSIVGRDVPAGLGIASTLRLGPAKLANVVFMVVADADLPRSAKWKGIIGAPVLVALEHLRFTRLGKLEIAGPSKPTSEESNLCFQQETMLTSAEFAKRGISMILDTGASYTRFHPQFFRAFGSSLQTTDFTLSTGGLGGGSNLPAKRVASLTLSFGPKELQFKNVAIALKPTSNASITTGGNLGWDGFSQAAAISFDFRTMRFQFE